MLQNYYGTYSSLQYMMILCVRMSHFRLQSQFSVGVIESIGRLDLCDLRKWLVNAKISIRVGELSPWKHRDEEREASGQRVPQGRG